jgi:hypothetical protein
MISGYVQQATAITGKVPRTIQSMSRRGNCLGNAPMKDIFAALKVEHVHQSLFAAQGRPVRSKTETLCGFCCPRLRPLPC